MFDEFEFEPGQKFRVDGEDTWVYDIGNVLVVTRIEEYQVWMKHAPESSGHGNQYWASKRHLRARLDKGIIRFVQPDEMMTVASSTSKDVDTRSEGDRLYDFFFK